MAGRARRGDVIALWGDLGVGKTAFARDFIHALQRVAGLPLEEVPSPTFTLVQVYPLTELSIWHFDLYRLADADEVYELGWEEVASAGIALIEWPVRLGGLLPAERMDIHLEMDAAEDSRVARLVGRGEPGRRLMGENA